MTVFSPVARPPSSPESRSSAGASVQPSGTAGFSSTAPRMSSMVDRSSRRASRCATSTTARSALPYSKISPLASASTERRTLSDQ